MNKTLFNRSVSKHKSLLKQIFLTVLCIQIPFHVLCQGQQQSDAKLTEEEREYYEETRNFTFERLNAARVDHSILFRLESIDGGKMLTYEIDTRDAAFEKKNTSRSHVHQDNKLSLACPNSSFNVMFDFFNPLRFSYKIKKELYPDPSTLALEKFYNQLIDLAKKVNPNSDFKNLSNIDLSQAFSIVYQPELDYSVNFIPGNNADHEKKLDKLRLFRSDELIDWALWYHQVYDDRYSTGSDVGRKNKALIDSIKSNYVRLEQYIYQTIPKLALHPDIQIDGIEPYFEPYIIELFRQLSEVNTLSEFREKLNKTRDAIKRVRKENAAADKLRNTIASIVLIDSGDELESYFNSYTVIKREVYLQKVGGIIKGRNEQLDDFEALLNNIDSNYLSTSATDNATKPTVVYIIQGKIGKITVEIVENKFQFENGKIKNAGNSKFRFQLVVSPYIGIVPEFGLGYSFSNIRYPRFAIDPNTSTVIENGFDKYNAFPMAALNLVPNIGRGNVFPMVQIGLGSNTNYPLFSTGAGLRVYSLSGNFLKNFSISAGAIWYFEKTLATLSVGSSVADQGDIDDDLRYTLHSTPRPYLGLQFNF